MWSPSLLRYQSQTRVIDSPVASSLASTRGFDDLIRLIRASLVQLTSVISHLNTQLSGTCYPDPHLFPALIQPCLDAFRAILCSAK
jgi:hypothetical protein